MTNRKTKKSEKPKRKRKKQERYPWREIREKYVQEEGTTYEDLIRIYGVSERQIIRRSKTENWKARREAYVRKVSGKSQEKTAEKQADEIARTIKIANMQDVINGVFTSEIQGEIAAAQKVVDKDERLERLLEIMSRKEVRKMLGSDALDRLARLKKYLRGEPDSIKKFISDTEAAAVCEALANVRGKKE